MPFSTWIWASLASFWIVGAIVLTIYSGLKCSYTVSFLPALKCFTEHAIQMLFSFIYAENIIVKSKSGLLTAVMFLGLITTMHYSNKITSYLTVKNEVAPLQTKRQMLESGYKIVSDKPVSVNLSREYVFLERFYWSNPSTEFVEGKLVWKVADTWRDWYIGKFNTNYKTSFGNTVQCNFVVESVDKLPWYLVIYTANRHWIM